MGRKKPRPPQEKKALSYVRDRRNTYGESDKASPKAIPLRKAQGSRQDRRKVAQRLAVIPNVAEEVAELIESSALHDVYRVGGWKKSADEPLGKIIANSLAAREARIDRKMRSANAIGDPHARPSAFVGSLVGQFERTLCGRILRTVSIDGLMTWSDARVR